MPDQLPFNTTITIKTKMRGINFIMMVKINVSPLKNEG